MTTFDKGGVNSAWLGELNFSGGLFLPYGVAKPLTRTFRCVLPVQAGSSARGLSGDS